MGNKRYRRQIVIRKAATAELAQSVERTTLNRVVVGSIPTFGANTFCCAVAVEIKILYFALP